MGIKYQGKFVLQKKMNVILDCSSRSSNGEDPESAKERVHFPALTPLYPDRHIKLETTQINYQLELWI